MRVFLFQSRFAPLVASGQKTQTIRKAARCKPGDMLSLREWTGKPYRSKQRVLREARCKSVEPVVVTADGVYMDGTVDMPVQMNEEQFASADGFASWPDMRDWFKATHGLPFDGELVTWEVGE